jgi:heme/copper-type cytochrome/quinol oxidase subunit 3
MVIKSIEYYTKFSHHLYPSDSTFMAIYFTLTGLHGLHVLGGMIVIAYHLFSGPGLWKSDPERLTNRVEVVGLYWHFVDLVWIFLFPLLYLL